MADATKGIGLKDLIRQVHEELALSEQEREEEGLDPLFEVEGLDLELNFVVREDEAARGGIDLKIFSLGSEISGSSEQVHKITLHLKTAGDRAPVDKGPRAPGAGLGRRPKRLS